MRTAAEAQRRLEAANPVISASTKPAAAWSSAVLLERIDRRSGDMPTQDKPIIEKSEPSRLVGRRRLGPALVGALFVIIAIFVAVVLLSGDDEPDVANQPTEQTTEVLITFDGATCSVSGGPLEPGLAKVSVLNTTPDPVSAIVVPLTSSYQVDDVAADVDAGRYQFRSDDPFDVGSFNIVNMGPNATEPSYNTFTATPGSFAVVCLDALGLKQFLAAEVFEVS